MLALGEWIFHISNKTRLHRNSVLGLLSEYEYWPPLWPDAQNFCSFM